MSPDPSTIIRFVIQIGAKILTVLQWFVLYMTDPEEGID